MKDEQKKAKEDVIKFIRQKNYIDLGPIGQGGLGKTILIKDGIIDEVFVCKKYAPVYEEVISEYFDYFVDLTGETNYIDPFPSIP